MLCHPSICYLLAEKGDKNITIAETGVYPFVHLCFVCCFIVFVDFIAIDFDLRLCSVNITVAETGVSVLLFIFVLFVVLSSLSTSSALIFI